MSNILGSETALKHYWIFWVCNLIPVSQKPDELHKQALETDDKTDKTCYSPEKNA